jgi:hypothetical protein
MGNTDDRIIRLDERIVLAMQDETSKGNGGYETIYNAFR